MNFGDGMVDGYGEGEEAIAFHHKNGEYRKYMDPKLADLAEGKNQPKRGFFRVLVSTRGNKMMFFVLCLTIAVYFGVSIFAKNSNEDVINGNRIKLSAFSFSEQIYLTFEMKPDENRKGKEEAPEFQKYAIELEFINSDGAVAFQKNDEYIFYGDDYYYRETYTDYDIVSVRCTVKDNESEKKLTAKVEMH